MKVLVTGPTGVLGSNLVRELLSREHEVGVFLLDGEASHTLDDLEIDRYFGNILKPNTLDNAMEQYDIVIHCAASTEVFPSRNEIVNKINVEGTRNVCDACLRNGIKRLICVGSANSFENGTSLNDLGTEENEFTAHKYKLDYIDSKRKAADLVLDYVHNEGLPAIVVNPTFMIGPYDSKPSSGEMIIALYKGKIPGYTGGGKNYVSVKDVSVAIANAMTMGRIGESYLLGNENLSFKEAFSKFANVIGVKPPKYKLPNYVTTTYGSANSLLGTIFKYKVGITKELAKISTENHYYSSEKAQNELKLPQTPIEIAVKECFEWFNDNNYLK